jgi:predicted transcriptional regulator with HTH domain
MKKKIAGHKAISFKNIIESLHSKERRNVCWYLSFTYPAWATIIDIARGVQSDYRNVKGALIGDGERYSKKLALVKVGLAERKIVKFGRQKRYMYRAKRRNSITVANNG